MSRSFAGGDFRLVMVVESSSRAEQWYRQGLDRAQSRTLRRPILSCDCPSWTNAQYTNRQGDRECKHTRVTSVLLGAQDRSGQVDLATSQHSVDQDDPIISAVQQRWPGLAGVWSLQQKDAAVGGDSYRFVLLRLQTPTGESFSGVVAFSLRHRPQQPTMASWISAWAGTAIAIEVAHRAGLRFTAEMPAYYRPGRRGAQRVGLVNLLQMANTRDLGDGLQPWQRAEATLRLFLGDLFPLLEQQGFLDVPSQRYPGRVYRLRRDSSRNGAQRRPRRVRVFINGSYKHDYCIMPAQAVPADDQFLTLFLLLCSGGEEDALAVVQRHNIFPPYSDGNEREQIPVARYPAPAAAA